MKKYMTIGLGILFLAGCSKDETGTQPDGKGRAVQFVSKVETRATASSFEANDAIGIYMIQNGKPLSSENIIENTANRHYETTDKNIFKPVTEEETVYFPKDNSTVDFISYYPHSAQVTDDFTIPVKVTDQSRQAAIDLLYSNNATKQNYTNPAAQLIFKHQLVRLRFILKPGKGLTDELMKGTTVTIKGMNTQGDFSLVTGKLTAKASEADITALTSADGKNSEALVLPDKGEGKQFIFVVNQEAFYYTLTPEDTLVSGEQYTYNVTLNRIENSITGKIETWTEVKRDIEVEP